MIRPHDRRSVWRVGPESTWTTVLPVAFIIVSLVSLAVLPILVERRTAEMRREITGLAEPARRTANQMQLDLAAELDKIIAYQVTRQQQYRDQYEHLLLAQQKSAALLRNYAPQLSPEAGGRLKELIEMSNRWHALVRKGGFLAPMPIGRHIRRTVSLALPVMISRALRSVFSISARALASA